MQRLYYRHGKRQGRRACTWNTGLMTASKTASTIAAFKRRMRYRGCTIISRLPRITCFEAGDRVTKTCDLCFSHVQAIILGSDHFHISDGMDTYILNDSGQADEAAVAEMIMHHG